MSNVPENPYDPATDAEELTPENQHRAAIGEHVEKYVGELDNVFREKASDDLALDVLVVAPTPERNFFTLVTVGMSLPGMTIPIVDPEDLGVVPKLKYAELMLCLPPDWLLEPEHFRDESNYWPIRWLKRLARLPHNQQAWLGIGHTIPFGDPPGAIAPNNQFCGFFIDTPVLFADDFKMLKYLDRLVNFYSVIPIFREEIDLKLKRGAVELGRRFDQYKINELVNFERVNVGSIS